MAPITHLLLDIEGTTCPVSFVAETLFPYARNHLAEYLERHRHEEPVRGLLDEAEQARAIDPEARAIGVDLDSHAQLVAYLGWLIDQDRKLPPLKQLQGLIWECGYENGELLAPLYSDVPPALRAWAMAGVNLAVYSSGSVTAQQLLYGHTTEGDLRDLFGHWFDTRTGPKQAMDSYKLIAAEMEVDPNQTLFISDSIAELEAAQSAGMKALFSDRPGNPARDNEGFARITHFDQIVIN
ncbi:acireductone synthase [Cyanobium sp. ATX 6F1]|uniref:acireductone synthase n=1 Tax=unclassified Cyanobium TaxID=2627006 RepID=UPI0020CDCC60|nr:acireductone synthase [Cyanobium sp. ATX 6F1]MCP9915389.1 acireductone synthase [Cyanobium sp. ATX 6F1]